ncbi:hypothetical protein, partial [Thermosulfurimonas sp.]|uniref:hypothetical protein n=1 Tax=Thermosulfurimonas sp. TaxID=2080236 RepID=UPI00343F3529
MQLCTVHLLRNARRHLSREHHRTFKKLFPEVLLQGDFVTLNCKAKMSPPPAK